MRFIRYLFMSTFVAGWSVSGPLAAQDPPSAGPRLAARVGVSLSNRYGQSIRESGPSFAMKLCLADQPPARAGGHGGRDILPELGGHPDVRPAGWRVRDAGAGSRNPDGRFAQRGRPGRAGGSAAGGTGPACGGRDSDVGRRPSHHRRRSGRPAGHPVRTRPPRTDTRADHLAPASGDWRGVLVPDPFGRLRVLVGGKRTRKIVRWCGLRRRYLSLQHILS